MDRFETDYDFSTCEYCHYYVKERLFVKLPKDFVIPRKSPNLKGKTHAYFCFDCIKLYCKSTLSDFWKMLLFPRTKEAREYKKRYK